MTHCLLRLPAVSGCVRAVLVCHEDLDGLGFCSVVTNENIVEICLSDMPKRLLRGI